VIALRGPGLVHDPISEYPMGASTGCGFAVSDRGRLAVVRYRCTRPGRGGRDEYGG
jgi:hypothetical protein